MWRCAVQYTVEQAGHWKGANLPMAVVTESVQFKIYSLAAAAPAFIQKFNFLISASLKSSKFHTCPNPCYPSADLLSIESFDNNSLKKKKHCALC